SASPLVPSGLLTALPRPGPRQLPLHLIGQRGMAQPPAPALARPYMPPHLSGNAVRGTRQAQQEGRDNPGHARALAAIQERSREVIAGALAGLLLTAIALPSGLVVVGAPRTDVVALTPRTWEGPILPPECRDVGVPLGDVEAWIKVREDGHG